MELSDDRIDYLASLARLKAGRKYAHSWSEMLPEDRLRWREAVRFLAAELEKDAKPGIRELVEKYIQDEAIQDASIRAVFLRLFAEKLDPPPKRKVKRSVDISIYQALDGTTILYPGKLISECSDFRKWTLLDTFTREVEVDEAPERDA